MRKNAAFLFLCLVLMLSNGCQTSNGTKFVPLEARLESLNDGGAQSMVLVNFSGQALHNVHFRAYMWGQSQLVDHPQPYMFSTEPNLPERVPAQTYTFSGSADKLAPAEVIHFRDRYTGGPSRILLPVTKVQIAGSCDEGVFRETWLMNGRGELVLAGVPKY